MTSAASTKCYHQVLVESPICCKPYQRQSQTKTNVFAVRKRPRVKPVQLIKINKKKQKKTIRPENLTFVVQSPDVTVHLVQELRVQQVHSSEKHLRERASC